MTADIRKFSPPAFDSVTKGWLIEIDDGTTVEIYADSYEIDDIGCLAFRRNSMAGSVVVRVYAHGIWRAFSQTSAFVA